MPNTPNIPHPPVPQRPEVRHYALPGGREFMFTDPFAWLEGLQDDPEALAVMDAQNAHTDAFMEETGTIPYWERQFRETKEADGDRTAGQYEGGFETFLEASVTDERYKVMGVKDGKKEVLVDPNAMEAGTSVSWSTMSPDGKYFAYAVQRHDREEPFVYLRSMESGDEHLFYEGARFHMDWLSDGTGFIYTESRGRQHNAPRHHHQRVMMHKWDQPGDEDKVLFDAAERGLPAGAWIHSSIADNGQHVLIRESVGRAWLNFFVLDTESGEHRQVPVAEPARHEAKLVGNDIYVIMKGDQDSDRIVRSPIAEAHIRPLEQWEEFVSRRGNKVIGETAATKSKFIVEHNDPRTLHSEATLIDQQTKAATPLFVPPRSSISVIRGDRQSDRYQYDAGNALVRRLLFSHDSGEEPFFDPAQNLDFANYETVHETCLSPQGREIGVTFAAAKGLLRQRDRAVLLSAYGGFRISAAPADQHKTLIRQWIAEGQIAAFPYLLGDGPSAQNHQAGMGINKHLVPDEVNAVARYIHESGISDRLGLSGGSMGATIVMAAALKQPQWYLSLEAMVGVHDLMEFPRFLDGQNWVAEYGDPRDIEQREAILRYSPLHIMTETDQEGPEMYITSGLNDTRVAAMHSLKIGAMRQLRQPRSRTLVEIDRETGHRWGLSARKWDTIYARRMAFLMRTLRVAPHS